MWVRYILALLQPPGLDWEILCSILVRVAAYSPAAVCIQRGGDELRDAPTTTRPQDEDMNNGSETGRLQKFVLLQGLHVRNSRPFVLRLETTTL